MTSPKALRDWCRLTCAGYPDVEIKNMSTSFRDGLVFCAIIHRHRPDLIDFRSLSRDNIYQNNKLAFEIAETKLGIPALLDPNDLLSSRVPDCLSIITYLSQYFHFFNRKSYAGRVSLKPSHVGLLNNLTKSKTPAGLKPRKSLTDLKTCREDSLSSSRPRTVCSLCFKPVHLIQRYLIDGKVYHRSCFRCRVCHCTLLPGSYTRGAEAGLVFCSHHTGDSLENWPRSTFEEGYLSLGGSVISSVPHYTKNTESQDGLVPETQERDGEDFPVGLKRKVKKPARLHRPHTPEPSDRNTQQEVRQTEELSECSSPRPQASDGSRRPVPAPRRMLDPSAGPVPSPRTKTNGSWTSGNAGDQNKSSAASSRMSSSGSPKVRTNHPWLNIVHPGPWTQLPPAPAPIPAPRTKFSARYRPRAVPPNPFAEDMVDQSPPKTDDLNPFADDMVQDGMDQGLPKGVSTNPFAEDMIEDSVDQGLSKSASTNPFAEDMVETTVDQSPPKTDDLNPFAEDMVQDSVEDGPPTSVSLNPFAEDLMEEDLVVEVVKEDLVVEVLKEDLVVEVVKEDLVVEVVKEDLVVEVLKEDLVVEVLKEDLVVEVVKEDLVVEVVKEDLVVEVVKEDLVVEVLKEDLVVEEDTAVDESRKPVQTKVPAAAEQSEKERSVVDQSGHRDPAVRPQPAEAAPRLTEGADPQEVCVPAAEGVVAVTAVSLAVESLSPPVKDGSQSEVMVLHEAGTVRGSLQDGTEAAAPHQAQAYILPRSLSVPAMTSSRCHSSSLPGELMEAQGYEQVSSSESKLACKENPFDRKSGMPKSKTFQSLPSRRGAAPGHGFPLIRRKVQTDQNVSTEDLRSEMRDLDEHLQTVEQRGVQLERNLRECKNDQQEEQMLTEFFSLVREKNSLVRRDTELIYLAKQQKLEERQADVEYELRCLLNKPEGDWSDADRGQEQQLMDELVTIIEERNEIIGTLDQDRLREQEEDELLEATKTDKELQKEEVKDVKKSKGKFKPTKMFKLLNHKAEDSKDSVGRKS